MRVILVIPILIIIKIIIIIRDLVCINDWKNPVFQPYRYRGQLRRNLRSEKTIYQATTNSQNEINSNEKLSIHKSTHIFFLKNYFEQEKIIIAILTLFFCLELVHKGFQTTKIVPFITFCFISTMYKLVVQLARLFSYRFFINLTP